MDLFSSVKPVDLKCEYKINPAGIDEKHPRFSWVTKSENYNSSQSSYRILIASSIQCLVSEQGDILDTGKVKSSLSNQVEFNGSPLQSNKTYFWKVMVWNENDEQSSWSEPAHFSTGLFLKNEWKAKWISHIYTEKPENSIHFHAGTDKWIWYTCEYPEDKLKTVYIMKSFQLDDLSQIENAELIVTADEKFNLYLNDELIAHSDDKIFSWARPVICNVKKLLKKGTNILSAEGLNSYVEKPGFIFRLEIKFQSGELIICTDGTWDAAIEPDKTKYLSAQTVAAAGEKPWRLPKAGLHFNPAAYLRKNFRLTGKVIRAFVYCSALGLYHLRINGKDAGESFLTPGWSNFDKKVYYNSCDVTPYLNLSDEIVLNVILADGYYAGYCGWEKGREYYGNHPAFKLQLIIDYDDGSNQVICTDESWLSSEGPIREADILMGELYDADYESLIEGWDSYNPVNENFKPVKVVDNIDPGLYSYKGEEIKIRQELKPYSVRKTGGQKFIIDFRQNFAGFVRLKINDSDRRKITLKFAEMLDDEGCLYRDNLRMARSQDTYLSKGTGEEIWQPLFTYHGFRYVEVTGLDNIYNDTITGCSINSLTEQTAYFESSDAKLNKLFACILWNQKSNYVDIPTDCPQRDERFGWTGDAVSFFKTAAFNCDVSAFYSKWLDDLFMEQREDGSLPPFAPLADMGVGPVYFNSAGWADAGIITPYMFYEFYDDKRMLEKYYERMKKFITSLENQSNGYLFPDYGYGDWLHSGRETSKSLIASAYFGYDSAVMKKIADVLGFKNDVAYYNKLFEKIKKAFRTTYLNKDGTLNPLTQTSAILAIYFNLLNSEEKEKAVKFLIQNIIDNNYHVTVGFLGLTFLMPVLSSIERNDIAWKIITNNEYPSWFFMIDNGATTMWERWDSWHPENGFYDPTMNSFNHCSLGCVGEWLFTDLAGLKMLEPGFKKFMIKPFIPEGISCMKMSYNSVQGPIKSEWHLDKNNLSINITVPFNCTSVIIIPADSYSLSSEHKVIKKADNFVYLEVGSGNYQITCAKYKVQS